MDVIPSDLKYKTPIFIAPGWGETPKTFSYLASLLFDAGFRVISVKHPREDFKLITKHNISKLEEQKAEIILSIFNFLSIDKVNLIAHSEGAINAVLAAHVTPSKFRDILLVGPGGLVENEGFLELLGRFVGNMFQNGWAIFTDSTARKHLIRSNIEVLKYFLMNPIMGLLEGSAISKTHLQKFLIDLHKDDISIGIIHGVDDVVFPLKKMRALRELNWIDFHSVPGDHNDIYAHPSNYVEILEKRFKRI